PTSGPCPGIESLSCPARWQSIRVRALAPSRGRSRHSSFPSTSKAGDPKAVWSGEGITRVGTSPRSEPHELDVGGFHRADAGFPAKRYRAFQLFQFRGRVVLGRRTRLSQWKFDPALGGRPFARWHQMSTEQSRSNFFS